MTAGLLHLTPLSNITLSEAIQLYQAKIEEMHREVDSLGIALLYSPRSCYFAKFESSGKLTIPNSKNPQQEIELELNYQKTHIFEARIFNEDYELRWLNEYDGKGKAVLLLETSLSNDSGTEKNFSSSLEQKNQSSEPLKFIDTIPQQYLIWGERIHDKSLDNWVTVSTARIGKLNIPLNQDLHKDQRIYLKTKEYLSEVDHFGNVSIIEERLINLEVK